MPMIATIAALVLTLTFCLGGLVGQQSELAWWKRNLLDQQHQPPGIRRRLGL
jgi:hypothetical protein